MKGKQNVRNETFMKTNTKKILLVNPWIHDFAAYDLWSRPIALLKIATILRQSGFSVELLDGLNRFDPLLGQFISQEPRKDLYGCGKFPKKKIEKPRFFQHFSRPYYRYGIPEALFLNRLESMPEPALVLVSSGMTFWYKGVIETISAIKKKWPRVPVILGGIYASLCSRHAQEKSGADIIFQGSSINKFLQCINELTHTSCSFSGEDVLPAVDLLSQQKSLVVQTSFGCPFSCTYCASNILHPVVTQRPVQAVIQELETYANKHQTTDIAFYDDALLYNKKQHATLIFKGLIEKAITMRLHTPNAIHARWIDDNTAVLMKEAGFKTVRLGLESSQEKRQQETGGKVSSQQFKKAVSALRKAGFSSTDIAAYVLAGLPGQKKKELFDDIAYISEECGIGTILASFSPLPGTVLWDRLVKEHIISDDEDPLWHNNTVFLTRCADWDLDEMRKLRKFVKQKNREIDAENILS